MTLEADKCAESPSSAQILLASKSPRRRELLAQVGLTFDVISVDVDQSLFPHESPDDYVQRLALLKALAGKAHAAQPWPVLGADTIIVLGTDIFGKPSNKDEALSMLEALSGRQHKVLTAVSMAYGSYTATRLATSRVSIRLTSAAEREAYWASGEPLGKAGAYAIQGRGAIFVERLEGSYSGVMGLPLFETANLLLEIGINPILQNAFSR